MIGNASLTLFTGKGPRLLTTFLTSLYQRTQESESTIHDLENSISSFQFVTNQLSLQADQIAIDQPNTETGLLERYLLLINERKRTISELSSQLNQYTSTINTQKQKIEALQNSSDSDTETEAAPTPHLPVVRAPAKKAAPVKRIKRTPTPRTAPPGHASDTSSHTTGSRNASHPASVPSHPHPTSVPPQSTSANPSLSSHYSGTVKQEDYEETMNGETISQISMERVCSYVVFLAADDALSV